MALTLSSFFLPVPARGELPTVTQNPESTRTVRWVMNDSAGLTTQNVSFVGGNASLAWTPVSMTWTRGSDFEDNASLWQNLSAGSTGVSLAANETNRLANPDFSSPGTWTYVNGSRDNTTSQWDGIRHAARLNHTSGQTLIVWDPLSSIVGSWQSAFSIGSNSNVYQAAGAMGDFVNVSQGVTQYAGAQHIGPVDWSAYDQFRMYVSMNASAPAAFNISALNSTFHSETTTAVPLSGGGWQTVTVNLSQLGSDRSSLTYLTLRIVGLQGQKLPPLSFLFMDVELGKAKVANTTARVTQLFDKANRTTAAPGSAYLSGDWVIENLTGVAGYQMNVTLSGPSGVFESPLVYLWGGSYIHFSADVSPYVVDSGTYNLTFALQVVVDNITASNVTAFVDNAVFVYPNRGSGVYISTVLSFGPDSRFLSLTWSAMPPNATTSVELQLWTGNASTGLGSWRGFTNPGTSALATTGVNFQFRAYLNTTNASQSPLLYSLSLSSSHRAPQGSIISAIFPADSDFLHWSSLNASLAAGLLTSVEFSVGNGSSWTPVLPGADLSTYTGGARIQWRAILTTVDGLVTPALANVSLVYDYLGPPALVVITSSGQPLAVGAVLNLTSGESVQLGALVYDSGGHPIPLTAYNLGWKIDNGSGGSVQTNGSYTAGREGRYKITVIATAAEGGVAAYATIAVNVSASASSNSTPPFSMWDVWPALAVAVAAIVGFSAYELAIRRLFAIDDVFLIAKDGRLILHNTRRMRADRDEDILSGMLTAIMAFIRDSDPEENGELKRFQIGGKTTLLERGEHVYLSAIYSGRVPGWAGKDLHRFMTDLEDRFGEAFAEWNGSPEDLRDLKAYMQRFVSHVRYHGDSGGARIEN